MKSHFLASVLIILGFSTIAVALREPSSKLPEGRNILRNGNLDKDPERAVHWVTRDSGSLGQFSLTAPEKEGDSGILKVDVKDLIISKK